MAFARAVAAGFDNDDMASLVSFADCFGASRLMNACLRFMDLSKKKHESGQWLEIEAADMANRPDLCLMNTSGITLTSMVNKHGSSNGELASDNNEKLGIGVDTGEKSAIDSQIPNGLQDNSRGQFTHPMFTTWPMHSPPGALPIFHPYPVQGMPYCQPYAGNGPFYQSPYQVKEDSRLHRNGRRRHSKDGKDSSTESDSSDDNSKTRSEDDMEVGKDAAHNLQPRKKGRKSRKKQSNTVVIRNINYITSKTGNTGNGTGSELGTESESEDIKGTVSRREASFLKSADDSNLYDKGEAADDKDDGGHWLAFQNCLLRGSDEGGNAANEGMFDIDKDVRMKRQHNYASGDPLAFGGRHTDEVQDRRTNEVHGIGADVARVPRRSSDVVLDSRDYSDSTGINDQMVLQFTESNGGKVMPRKGNDDLLMSNLKYQTEVGNSSGPLDVNGFEHASKLERGQSLPVADESFIVPFRSMSLDQIALEDRISVNVDSELPPMHKMSQNISSDIKSHVNYEPDCLSLIPERGVEKMSLGYNPTLGYEMQVCDEGSTQHDKAKNEVVTEVREGSKKVDKERRSKVTDSLDKRRAGGPLRKGKPSKMSPLEDARARAEKIRSFKADMQKLKKEKEEADLKRLEALRLERQKRIAARGGSASTQSSMPSIQARKLPTKLSPVSRTGSKFSDSEPGSSSPLQRSKIRMASLGSSDSQKVPKISKPSDGNHLSGNRLSRSVSSLSESKNEGNGSTPEPKASMARIRRLSEPKTVSNHSVTSAKSRSTEPLKKHRSVEPLTKTRTSEPVSRVKTSDGPDNKKISAILNLDKSKAATLPELKIRSPQGSSEVGQSMSTVKESQKASGRGPTPDSPHVEFQLNEAKFSEQSDEDENPIIEKTVVMLEYGKQSVPVSDVPEENKDVQDNRLDTNDREAKSGVVTDYMAIRTQPSPMEGDNNKDPNEVRTSYAEDLRKPSNLSTNGKACRESYAPVSSLGDSFTGNSQFAKAPRSPEQFSLVKETVKEDVADPKSSRANILEASVIAQVKESPKGFRRLLKFGKKNTGDQSFESEGASTVKHDDVSSAEVHTLKNLISQDETPPVGSASQKSSRHFSLLSPFRSKTRSG